MIYCDDCDEPIDKGGSIFCEECQSRKEMGAIAEHLRERPYWATESAEESLEFIADRLRDAGYQVPLKPAAAK